ncbi:MAG TPA: metallophosphoesterase [Polyangia bacterium]|nr:metallophosphoesterase [Polyangia bacterium]
MKTLAHLSDLHFGSGARAADAATALVRAIDAARVDHVVVTGDVTHRGLYSELDRFARTFAPLQSRLTVIPGNHDRLGDDAARALMSGGRVQVDARDGLYLVRVDSTGPHNRYVFAGHGELTLADLYEIDRALDAAPADALVVVILHHHPLPLPEEQPLEKIASFVGLPFAAELDRGSTLLERLRGRADLVLHGHRHVPAAQRLYAGEARPLDVVNAGSSTGLGRARVFAHDAGRLCAPPAWLSAELAALHAA